MSSSTLRVALGWLSDKWLSCTECLTGPWTLHRTPVRPHENRVFEIETVKGTFSIYCHPVRYTRCFKRWWVPNHHHRLFYYYLYTENQDLPTDVKQAMEKITHLPDLQFFCLSIKQESKLMLSAYLDILLQDMANGKPQS